MSTSSSLSNPYDAEHWGQWNELEKTMLNHFQDLRDSQDKIMFTDNARSSLKETITELAAKSQELNQNAAASSLDIPTMLRLAPALLGGNMEEFQRQVNELMSSNPAMIDASADATKKTIQYGIEQGLLHAEAFTDLDRRTEVLTTAERMALSTGLMRLRPNSTERSA